MSGLVIGLVAGLVVGALLIFCCIRSICKEKSVRRERTRVEGEDSYMPSHALPLGFSFSLALWQPLGYTPPPSLIVGVKFLFVSLRGGLCCFQSARSSSLRCKRAVKPNPLPKEERRNFSVHAAEETQQLEIRPYSRSVNE